LPGGGDAPGGGKGGEAAFGPGSSHDLLIREVRDIGALTGVLDCDSADVAISIYVQERVLIEVLGLGDVCCFKLDVKRVCVVEVLNFYGLNELSKKALCTVSPSGRSITRNTWRPSPQSAPTCEYDRPAELSL
jgi:hypothetical protein